MSKRTAPVQLTLSKAKECLWAAECAYDQLGKFLRHDDWDYNLSKRERRLAMASDRRLKKIEKHLRKVIAQAQGRDE